MSDDADPRAVLRLQGARWTCESVNAAWRELTGSPAELLVGEPIGALLTDRFVAEALGRLCDLAALTATVRQTTTPAVAGRSRLAAASPLPPASPDEALRVVLSLAPGPEEPPDAEQVRHELDAGALELVLVVDRAMRVTAVNDAVVLSSGVPAQEIVGKNNREMGYPPVLADMWDAHTRHVLASGQPHVITYVLPTVLGARSFQSWLCPERDASGAVVAVIVTSRDISHERLAEAVTRARPADGDCVTAVWEHFVPTPKAAAAARKVAGAWLAASGLAAFDHEVSLAVSELVTNAAMHAGTPLYLQAQHARGVVRVEVHDGSTTLPVLGESGTVGGRGLSLVAALATSWGAERTASGGKVVWCEFVAGSEPAAAALAPQDLLELWSE